MKRIFNRPWPVVAALAVAGFFFLLFLLLAVGGLRFNSTPSLPKGLYRLSSGSPGRGDYVTFCLGGEYAALARERGYVGPGSCPSGLRPLLKKVAGLPGDEVCRSGLAIRTEDSRGLPLPSALLDGVIPDGFALVLADHPGSFDGRYFGLVPLDSLRRVEPLFLFNSKEKKYAR